MQEALQLGRGAWGSGKANGASRMEICPGRSGFAPGQRAGELTRLESEMMYALIQMNSFKSLKRHIVLIAT